MGERVTNLFSTSASICRYQKCQLSGLFFTGSSMKILLLLKQWFPNNQVFKVIIGIVHVGVVKIYVATVEALFGSKVINNKNRNQLFLYMVSISLLEHACKTCLMGV
jgi:hypothetical protein